MTSTDASQLTAEQIRSAKFRAPGWGMRGYDAGEVQAFLNKIADSLEHQGPEVSAQDVHDVVFHKSRPRRAGFRELEVDVFLERIEGDLRQAG